MIPVTCYKLQGFFIFIYMEEYQSHIELKCSNHILD